MTDTLLSRIRSALDLRRQLPGDLLGCSCRLFNGEADGIPGLVVDRFGECLIAQLHPGRLTLGESQARSLVQHVHAELGTKAVYRKTFVQSRTAPPPEILALHRSSEPWIGEVLGPELTVTENGLRFLIRPYDGSSVGLFLEHRDNRRRIRELSSGKRVLNTFAYTCGFSVAAAAGGAASVASVDLSKRHLEWGKLNFDLNGIDLAGHWFFCSDIFDFVRRAQRQGRRYDLIILDPPTFSRARRPHRAFAIEQDLEPLCAEVLTLLDPGGIVLLATNHRDMPTQRLEDAVQRACQAHDCRIIERPSLPPDFAGDPDYSKAIVAQIS